MVSEVEARTFQRALVGLQLQAQKRMQVALDAVAKEYAEPERVRDASIGVTQNLTVQYGAQAAVFAAGWYSTMRVGEGVKTPYRPRPVTFDTAEAVEGTVRRAAAGLFAEVPDLSGVFKSITDRASKYVVDQARETIRANSFRDPVGRGWKRVAIGETCDFCLMLTGRGGVYKETTARFKSHVGCNCVAVPSWDQNAPEVPAIAYEASARMERIR